MKKIAITVAAGLTMAAGASADLIKDYSVSTSYFPNDASNVRGGGLTFDTGFEDLSLGPISGQAGWGVFTANPDAPAVSDANPNAGNQHLRISQGVGAANSLNGAFSPNLGTFASGPSVVSVDVSMNTIGGADAQIIAQAPSQGSLSWRVIFSFTGGISVLDDTGSGLAFIDTGATWVENEYANLTVSMDPDANTIDYSYDGNLIYSSAAGVFAGTGVEQVILASDNFYNDDTESISYDNLSVAVPTPGAMALLGMAGFAATRRRR